MAMFDPSVLLGAQGVKTPDPLTQTQAFMTLSQLANQNAMSRYALAKAQREDQQAQDLQSALPALLKSGWTDQSVADAMGRYPNAAAAIQSQAMAVAKARAEQAKEAAQAGKFNAEADKERYATFANIAGAAAAAVQSGKYDPMRALGEINFTAQRMGIDPRSLGIDGRPIADPTQAAALLQRASEAAMTAYQRGELADKAAVRVETNRSHLANEALTASGQAETARSHKANEANAAGMLGVAKGNLAARQAEVDPYGILGVNKNAAGGGGSPVAQAMANGLSGEQFLATLPTEVAGQVKALAEGRMSLPTGFALKSPQIQALIAMTSQYDPSFDAANAPARVATRKSFTSGKDAQSLNALNTVMQHMAELKAAGDALGNTDYPLVNKVKNAVGAQVNPQTAAALDRYNAASQAVISEMERAYRGAGGSEADLARWRQSFNTSQSDEARMAVLQQMVDLLGGKIDALGDTYSKGMGVTKDGLSLLNPKAQATFNSLHNGGKPAAPASGQTFDRLPDPKQYAGKRMKDDSGTVWVSDGATWKRQ